jgi:hypothetical protein
LSSDLSELRWNSTKKGETGIKSIKFANIITFEKGLYNPFPEAEKLAFSIIYRDS